MIKLTNLGKKFGDKQIFNQFNLAINAGEMIALVGESGSGKSTLLNILGLIEDFDSGEYLFLGEKNIKTNTKKASKNIREKISYLFQNFALIETETVEENLQVALKYSKVSKQEKQIILSKALEKVGLKGYEKRKVHELSGGEQQRVAIARVLIKPSEIVLADEPTGSLDSKNRDEVLNLLKEMNKKGKTIVIVTHDPKVSKNCSRIVELV
ncbi:MAG: ABC transporter ATP-binding protein [Streptococcaceae bacterium]|jgi:putative ABC transport system ATP-binding protein|nr:ABC transporter ATP-binding protein [Streptococcaceae bacterium]